MPRAVGLMVLLLSSSATLEAAPRKNVSEEERKNAEAFVQDELEAASSESAAGDYAAAATRLEKAAAAPESAKASSKTLAELAETARTYARRRTWAAAKKDAGAAKALLKDLLIGSSAEQAVSVDARLLDLVALLRTEDAAFSKAFAPVSVRVLAKDPLAESAAQGVVEKLNALGYVASTSTGQVLWELTTETRTNGDFGALFESADEKAPRMSMTSCTAALAIRSTAPELLPGLAETRATTVHINGQTCLRKAATLAGERVTIELLRSWARATP